MVRTHVLTALLTAAVASGTAVAVAPRAAEQPQTDQAAASGPGFGANASTGWLGTWASMPQLTEPNNLPPAPFTGESSTLVDTTIRQTVHATIPGRAVRIRLSNAFGSTDLPVTAASIALPVDGAAGVSGIVPGSLRRLTFGGTASTVIPAGAQSISDPIPFPVRALSDLTVTLYFATGQQTLDLTSHPGSRTTSYLLNGNHVADESWPAGGAAVAHWYVLSGVDVDTPGGSAGLAIVGDSISDGRGSTTNRNDRWPDTLSARLQADPSTRGVSVLNQAAGGNRVLHDGLGPSARARFDRDVIAQAGVACALVFEGVNDLGTAEATPEAQAVVVDQLISAFQQMVVQAHAHGIKVFGATITPFGGNTGYDDPAGLREVSRQAVNTWIRARGHFDGVVDFDAVTRDPAAPGRLLPGYDTGDHLHLNPVGYRAMGSAVPLAWFRGHPGR